MTSASRQLNPFELKSALNRLMLKINSPSDIQKCLPDFEILDNQEDKTVLAKLLFKELPNCSKEKISILCFLIERYVPQSERIEKFWDMLKHPGLNSDVKITVLNLLREIDSDWSYKDCEDVLGGGCSRNS